MAKILVVMGVAGCGKTTIGRMLADYLGWTFYDGDDYHSADNKEKMAANIPLTDDDRLPWLKLLASMIDEWQKAGESAVLACSCLKASYRDVLGEVDLVYLRISPTLARERLAARKNHYMKEGLIESQFAALEEPSENEAIVIDADAEPASVIKSIVERL